jgi:2-deoxy-D-gluconate 3-dehydrogenase
MSVLKNFRLDGRVIIITGGAGFLGREYTKTIAEAGGIPVVCDIDADAAVKIAKSVAKTGARTLGLYVDITDKNSVNSLIDATLGKFGHIDGLVNNAGLDPKFDPDAVKKGIPPGAFEDYPLEDWNAAIGVNLTGMFLVTQACVGVMQKQGKKGSIVNISSTYGLNGPDQRIYIKNGKRVAFKPVYYPVSKAGVLGFTKYLAAYYAGTKIRVNALTPGGVFNKHDEYFVKNYSSKTILGRMARKDEMNGALLFLISDASSYMTGSNLVIDGGWTAW